MYGGCKPLWGPFLSFNCIWKKTKNYFFFAVETKPILPRLLVCYRICIFLFPFVHLRRLQRNRFSLHTSTFTIFPYSLFLTLFRFFPMDSPSHTKTPLTEQPRQIYSHRLSIGRHCDSWDLTLPSHWPRRDRLIYGCTVIWCLLPLKWVTALSLIGHRNGVRLQS